MNKVFLYMYPIKEYTDVFLLPDYYYSEIGRDKPLPVLNKCIQKRYRDNGYKIIFLNYYDKDIYGINLNNKDRIIYSDISFYENSSIDDRGISKDNFVPKYTNDSYVLEQIGDVQRLVIGGYHFNDCVKRMALYAFNNGIDTLIDIDMTDLFFGLYKDKDYFQIDNYDPSRYMEYLLSKVKRYNESFILKKIESTYSSPIYGFEDKMVLKKAR